MSVGRHHLCEFKASKSRAPREAFGYAVMGPILADMLRQLGAHLQASRQRDTAVVFFCARGGLMLRRTLELFADRIGLNIQVRCADFMVSRLTAVRTALQFDPLAIAPLIEQEFAQRSCAEAAGALANVKVGTDARWSVPFKVARWIELTETTEVGRRIRAINNEQADLLRQHINSLRGTSGSVMLCDTGVFGSIARYLQVGVPAVHWQSTLLFRANYKHIPAPHFKSLTGVVSESDAYLPWRPATAVLLYWQLMEAMLEPPVSTVRYYRMDSGRVISDLETGDWRQCLSPAAGSMLAGACAYIGNLTPGSIPSIQHCGQIAWSRLRRRIVFPTREDVALLAVGPRKWDFGLDETTEFTSRPDQMSRSLRAKFAAARASMWPEGELRKQFPRTAAVFLLGSELSRWARALRREWISMRPRCDA
jgi:hypothetical protein